MCWMMCPASIEAGALWSWGLTRGDRLESLQPWAGPRSQLLPRECPGAAQCSSPSRALSAPAVAACWCCGDVELFLPLWQSSQGEGGRWTWQAGPFSKAFAGVKLDLVMCNKFSLP